MKYENNVKLFKAETKKADANIPYVSVEEQLRLTQLAAVLMAIALGAMLLIDLWPYLVAYLTAAQEVR